jgi:NTE family protein
MFLVVDAGRGPSGEWTRDLSAPGGLELATIVTGAAIDASVHKGYDYFHLLMKKWEADLRRWRCSLSVAEVTRLRGSADNWSCSDVSFYVELVSFDDAGPALKAQLDAVPTRFRLDSGTLDMVVESGSVALRNNPVFRSFLRRTKGLRREGAAT